ncbi:MAG: ABC transporter permease [Cytophagales bacterium]|nr:ABC transporter permease [Cytophagales bacterium]
MLNKFSVFIAWRYLFSIRSSLIHFISGMAVIGVALGTMALIIVLSVFNGLETVIKSIYGSFDPDIKIESKSGKTLIYDNELKSKLLAMTEIQSVTEAIEDNALVKYMDNQTIVRVKGVSKDFINTNKINTFITEGKTTLAEGLYEYGIVGRGVQYKLGIDMNSKFYQLQFWYPKRTNTLSVNPENAFNIGGVYPGGIFAIERQFDDYYIFVPLSFAQKLMGYDYERTSIELKLKPDVPHDDFKSKIQKILGDKYLIRTADEQHVSILRAVKIEKLFVLITFTIILGISSLTIFFSLTMVAVEKKHDIALLSCMGCTSTNLRNIFLTQGLMIGVAGAISGLVLGYVICILQQKYGLISMGTETSLIDTYPVKMKISDFVVTGCIIIFITIGISLQPAFKASAIKYESG